MSRTQEVIELEQLELWEQRRNSLFHFMMYLKPELVPNWHHKVIGNRLSKLSYEQKKNLVIMLPPQCSKSEMVSRFLPAFLLGHKPWLKIILASYSAELADSFNREVQRVMDSAGYRELFPNVRLNEKNVKSTTGGWKRTNGFFEVVGYGGYLKTIGVGGSLTGFRADCFVGNTMIHCEHTQKRIDEVSVGDKVLSYNHKTNSIELDTVLATRTIKKNETVTVKTKNGKSIESTPDHRIFSGGAYREASGLEHGASLTTIEAMDQVSALWHGLSDCTLRSRKEDQKRLSKNVLFKEVYGRQQQSRKTVRDVWQTSRKEAGSLLRRLSKSSQFQTTQRTSVSNLRSSVPTEDTFVSVLLKRMCKSPTQSTHEERRQSSIHTRARVSSLVPKAQTTHHRTRQSSMFNLRWKKSLDSSSHRRLKRKQPSIESHNDVSLMSYETPQIKVDSVSSVERNRYQIVTVYDIQTEKNHNFFANGILAHNCMIVDDPIKGREQADSHVVQERAMEWYQSVALTRCSRNANRIIMHTPWSLRDISFRMMKIAREKERSLQWEWWKFPAVAEGQLHEKDPREPGDPIFPAWYGDKEDMEEKRLSVGEREWSSLYQCNPTPRGGTIIKEDWINYYYTMPDVDKFEEIIQSWDLRFSRNANANDFVVGQVWGRIGSEKYLLDHVRGRWSFRESINEFQKMTKRWPTTYKKLVENKANGPALEDTLRREIGGIVLWEPQGNKEQRLYKCEPAFEAGNVMLPASAPWRDEVVFELTTFPTAPHDDIVDATTMAVIELMKTEGRTFEVLAL